MNKKAILALTILAAGCSWPLRSSGQAEKNPMTKKEELFRRIESLKKTKSLRPDSVAKALGLPESLSQVDENDYYTEFEAEAPADSSIARVELRAQKDAARGAFVVVDLREGSGVRLEDVRSRFGADPAVSPPNPKAPKDSPIFYVYSSKAAELRFGFSREEPESLVSVVYKRLK